MTDAPFSFFPSTSGRASAIAAGFRFGHIGTHTSRTIMLNELATTLQSVPVGSTQEGYADAIIQDNCLSKPTASTRRLSFQRLRELYALDPPVPIFRILRRLWDVDKRLFWKWQIAPAENALPPLGRHEIRGRCDRTHSRG